MNFEDEVILKPVSLLHRWKNYWIRGVLSIAMISGFFLIIYMGPIALILIVSDGDTVAIIGFLRSDVLVYFSEGFSQFLSVPII